jgi:hypothetical protein
MVEQASGTTACCYIAYLIVIVEHILRTNIFFHF